MTDQTSPRPDGGTPLQDLRVTELGQLLAGPFCGQLPGDFGAGSGTSALGWGSTTTRSTAACSASATARWRN